MGTLSFIIFAVAVVVILFSNEKQKDGIYFGIAATAAATWAAVFAPWLLLQTIGENTPPNEEQLQRLTYLAKNSWYLPPLIGGFLSGLFLGISYKSWLGAATAVIGVWIGVLSTSFLMLDEARSLFMHLASIKSIDSVLPLALARAMVIGWLSGYLGVLSNRLTPKEHLTNGD